jgi:hypothetical protein
MASPAELVRTVSLATGVPLATIVDIDRKLVKAELRAKTGRGFNAAQMTPIDAARILTAVLASDQANASAEAVERYAQTRPDKTRSSDRLFRAVNIEDLAALPAGHSFVDGLTALIASAAAGSLATLMTASESDWAPHIEVFAFTRATRGRIRIAGLPNGLTASIEYIPAIGIKTGRGKTTRRKRIALDEDSIDDLEQSRRITERTILPIARLLAAENRDDRA